MAALGAISNAINGSISPQYFKSVMGWDFEGIRNAAVAQGIVEGLIYGLILVVVLGIVMNRNAASEINLARSLSHTARVALFAIIGYIIGGAAGMGIAKLSPDFFSSTFKGVPALGEGMMAYAWVGGAIWGLIFGGIVGLVISISSIRSI